MWAALRLVMPPASPGGPAQLCARHPVEALLADLAEAVPPVQQAGSSCRPAQAGAFAHEPAGVLSGVHRYSHDGRFAKILKVRLTSQL